ESPIVSYPPDPRPCQPQSPDKAPQPWQSSLLPFLVSREGLRQSVWTRVGSRNKHARRTCAAIVQRNCRSAREGKQHPLKANSSQRWIVSRRIPCLPSSTLRKAL